MAIGAGVAGAAEAADGSGVFVDGMEVGIGVSVGVGANVLQDASAVITTNIKIALPKILIVPLFSLIT